MGSTSDKKNSHVLWQRLPYKTLEFQVLAMADFHCRTDYTESNEACDAQNRVHHARTQSNSSPSWNVANLARWPVEMSANSRWLYSPRIMKRIRKRGPVCEKGDATVLSGS